MFRVRLATPTEVAVPALATLQEQRYRLAYAPTAGSPDSGRDQLVLPRRRFSGHDRLDTGSCDEACPRRRHMWTFLRVNGVEPTNNTADRALSPAVIYRKLSFGTQSRYGTPVSGTPAEGLGNLSTAGPKCLREVGVRHGGQVQTGKVHLRFSMPPWGRANRLESHTGPLTDTGAETADSNQHRWPTPTRERLPFDFHPMEILSNSNRRKPQYSLKR